MQFSLALSLGLIQSAFSLKLFSFSNRGRKMNKEFIISGFVFLVLAGLAGADFISTSISTDGTMLLASSGHNDNGSFASRVMTVDQSDLSRSISGSEILETDVSVKGSGPLLVSDYASGVQRAITDPAACVFLTEDRVQVKGTSELYTTGILNRGNYAISRKIDSGLTGGTDVNGSGMMSLGNTDSENSYRFFGKSFVR